MIEQIPHNMVTLQEPCRKYPILFSANDMIDRTAQRLRVSRRDLIGNNSIRYLARGRWAMMLFLRRRGWSMPRIGAVLGGRDNTTVMHGLQRAEALCLTDLDFKRLCEAIQ